jgi:hypothetical protein
VDDRTDYGERSNPMHSTPARVALAGSILVLGSVGTVTAVQLWSAPAPLGRTSGTPRALFPAPTAPQAPAPTSPDVAAPPASTSPTPRGRHDGPVSAPELVQLGTAALSDRTVRVATDDLGDAVRDSLQRAAESASEDGSDDGTEDGVADDLADDAHRSATVRRVAVRGGGRHRDDESEQARRELARGMAARFSQSPAHARPVPARCGQPRVAGPSATYTPGSRRISDPFRASQPGYSGVTTTGYVGRHRR